MSKAIVAVLLLLAVALGVRADSGTDAEASYYPHQHSKKDVKDFKRFTVYVGDVISARGGAIESEYTIGAFEYKVRCGSLKGEVIGTCSETGIYLSKPASGTQQGNWQWSCEFTEECDNVGKGTLNGLGRAPGGDWAVSDAYPVTFTVEGGTGDFDHVIGGTVTFKADKSAKYTLFYA